MPGYRNHVYRTITYAMNFLGNVPQQELLVETVFAYHDIGLRTDHQLAYLEPSAAALADNAAFGWSLDEAALCGTIHWHHKKFPCRGVHAQVIETCRKADWIDASKGMLRKDLPRVMVREVERRLSSAIGELLALQARR